VQYLINVNEYEQFPRCFEETAAVFDEMIKQG
jgi:hypothetical protein